jgi:hypothetical protein
VTPLGTTEGGKAGKGEEESIVSKVTTEGRRAVRGKADAARLEVVRKRADAEAAS